MAETRRACYNTRSLAGCRPGSWRTLRWAVAAEHADVIMLNKYHGWYTNTGQLDIIRASLRRDVLTWRRAFHKPVMISEFGVSACSCDP